MFKKLIVNFACGLTDAILMYCVALVGRELVIMYNDKLRMTSMFVGMSLAFLTAIYIRFNHKLRPSI